MTFKIFIISYVNNAFESGSILRSDRITAKRERNLMTKIMFGLEVADSRLHYQAFRISYFHFCALETELDGDKLYDKVFALKDLNSINGKKRTKTIVLLFGFD